MNTETTRKRIEDLEFGIVTYANRILHYAQTHRKAKITNTLCEWAESDAKMLMLLRNKLAQ